VPGTGDKLVRETIEDDGGWGRWRGGGDGAVAVIGR
jgi:hypothetical protein